MISHTFDLRQCRTALEFLDSFGESLDTKFLNFSFLTYYLKKNHFTKITFTSTKKFQEMLPNTVRELRKVLEEVKGFYQDKGLMFEYELK